MSPNAATTASAAPTVNGPENTPSRRSAARSAASSRPWLQSSDAFSVCCRSTTVRAPPVNNRKRSSSSRAICSSARLRQRAAANSIDSGIPSSRAQIRAMAPAASSVSTRSGRARRARSTNSRAASRASRSSQRSAAPTDRARQATGHARRSHREPTTARDWSPRPSPPATCSAPRRRTTPTRRSRARSCPARATSAGRRRGRQPPGPAVDPAARGGRSRRAPRPAANSDRSPSPTPPTTLHRRTGRPTRRRPATPAGTCRRRPCRSASPDRLSPIASSAAAVSASRPINDVRRVGRLWPNTSSDRNGAELKLGSIVAKLPHPFRCPPDREWEENPQPNRTHLPNDVVTLQEVQDAPRQNTDILGERDHGQGSVRPPPRAISPGSRASASHSSELARALCVTHVAFGAVVRRGGGDVRSDR